MENALSEGGSGLPHSKTWRTLSGLTHRFCISPHTITLLTFYVQKSRKIKMRQPCKMHFDGF